MINNIWILIGKKLNNEASSTELEDLARLLKEDVNGNYPMELIDALWNEEKETDETHDNISTERLEEKWQEFTQLINRQVDGEGLEENNDKKIGKRRFWIKKYILALVACLVVLFVSIVAVKMIVFKKSPAKNIEIPTAKGSMRQISLQPDGSSVILNAGSHISYKKTFDSKHRALYLAGEALFKESATPIKKESKFAEPPTIKLIELGQVTKKRQDSIPEEMMWMNHQIVFDSELFGEIAKEIERKYNVTIIFKNVDAEKYRFTGRFDDIPIDQVLDKLELISKFNYKINGDVITIY